jgi:hypothetical protein
MPLNAAPSGDIMGHSSGHSSWTRGFIVVFALVQLVVPAIMLREPRPARVGWQMFTQGRKKGDFAVVRSDGSRMRIRIADYAAEDIPEVPYYAFLPAHLCRVVPEADAVVVTGATGMSAPEIVTPCR